MCVTVQITGGENGEETRKAVLTAPLSLDGESGADYRAPNIVQRVLSLFKNVLPGSDLTLQLTPQFNMPKSHLQCFGESVYCVQSDMLSKCATADTPLDRFTSVVAWSISILRPLIFGVAPYNPVLGETHHVSRGSFNVLLEQISHHPPVSALHATDESKHIELIWCQRPVPKFHGTGVEAEVHGKRELNLLAHSETYLIDSPKLFIRFFPMPGVDWVGNVRIRCEETGIEAELCYGTSFFLGFGGNQRRSVKGRIFLSSSPKKTIYEINGHWDRTVSMKDISSGKVTVIYNAKEVISNLKTPVVEDPKGVWSTESSVVWSEVSQGILSKNWDNARIAKKIVEEKQRELLRERQSRGEAWVPKHFLVSNTKEGGWECSPIHKWVPPAPIIAPI
ncbi:Oxysterol-binding protein [Dillenia turbinata]|uniref:Oxysterol-binding protein n=1 Tax=Dillenia turbinata TaxID=194707 RepID=A0AAN8W9U6_9MAGN